MVNEHVLRRQRIKGILLKTVNCGDEQVLTRAIYISLLSISFRHVLFIFETDLAVLVCLSRQVTVTENNEADKVSATKGNNPKLRFFSCFLLINVAVHVHVGLHLTLSRKRRALLIRLVFFISTFQIYIMLCLNFDFYIIPLTLLLTFLKQYVMCMLLADRNVNPEEQVC